MWKQCEITYLKIVEQGMLTRQAAWAAHSTAALQLHSSPAPILTLFRGAVCIQCLSYLHSAYLFLLSIMAFYSESSSESALTRQNIVLTLQELPPSPSPRSLKKVTKPSV